MAAGRAERGSRGDDDGHSTRMPSLWCAVVVVAAAMVMLDGVCDVQGAPTPTNDTMIVSKTLLAGPCVDNSGTEVADQAEWTTGCDRVVCHVEPSGNYTVTHGCRSLVPSENPDDTNCVTVQNSGSAYPDCCPYLQCGAASGISTLNPSLCYDISDNSTCQIWKELSSNCTDSTAYVYNFTLVYCQQTCGFCSVSG